MVTGAAGSEADGGREGPARAHVTFGEGSPRTHRDTPEEEATHEESGQTLCRPGTSPGAGILNPLSAQTRAVFQCDGEDGSRAVAMTKAPSLVW